MEQEKKYFGGWFVWAFFLMVVSGIVLTGLNYAGIIGRTIIEREVFEQSYQKKAADHDRMSTYQATLAEIQGRLLNPNLDTGTRANLEAQASSIRIMIRSNGGM